MSWNAPKTPDAPARYAVRLSAPDDFEGWRAAARQLAMTGVDAADIVWRVGAENGDLFAEERRLPIGGAPFTVPKAFIDLAETAILHSDPQRFTLLYALLAKLRDAPQALGDRADPLVARLEALAKAVRRDIHKMRAFVRFRAIEAAGEPVRFVAWFEPDHHIVRANAGFFVRRFANMLWAIMTPETTIHWDGQTLLEGPGAVKADAPSDDPVEDIWKSYYAAIFNPARLKVGAMLSEMPKKYWKNMPEAVLVPGLIAGAQAREAAMLEAGTSPTTTLPTLRDQAAQCVRCPLYRDATQTVFGEGPLDASLFFIGEQPGDQEDLAGRPFVGPAGQLFDQALADAGVDRGRAYVTNAVKHFKFERRGKRRIHQTPEIPEINACRWWVEQEMALVKPRLIVALGATAARSLLGKAVTISRMRGAPIMLESGAEAWITVHPSYLLRIPNAAKAAEEKARFVEELRTIGARLAVLDQS